MTTYKETILKTQDVNWKQPTIKLVEDGRMDLIFTIPLTEVLDLQAKLSFFAGIKAVTDFVKGFTAAGGSTASQDFARRSSSR